VASPEDEKLERLAAIGEIAAEVAHELRNVLQIISASAFVGRQDPPNSLPQLEKIERNARLAFSIVDDLMSLARGEPAQTSPVLVAEVVVAARAEIDPGEVHWEDAITPSDLRMRAHAGLVARVLHALYENAKHVCAPRPPSIATRASRQGDRVVFEVADDGPGVPADIAPRIFDPLVTGRGGGSGLGLALARRIVAAHGGTIALAEGRPGHGATFRIEFPSG
jgi:signal transduction histidine kinase